MQYFGFWDFILIPILSISRPKGNVFIELNSQKALELSKPKCNILFRPLSDPSMQNIIYEENVTIICRSISVTFVYKNCSSQRITDFTFELLGNAHPRILVVYKFENYLYRVWIEVHCLFSSPSPFHFQRVRQACDIRRWSFTDLNRVYATKKDRLCRFVVMTWL